MRLSLAFVLVLLWPLTSYAEPQQILPMHGETAYTGQSPHLSYVNPDAPKGGSIKYSEIGTFDTLNPYAIKGNSAKGLNLVYDRLMARIWDEPFTMVPLIAESYETNEARSEITFHLNPLARFHDGSPITAEDVLFSFETLKNEGRPNMRRIYRLVESAEKTGERSVHFKLGEGYDRETIMILALMPVLSKQWWEGRVFDQTVLDVPMLNGPYRIKNFDPGKTITYERVPDYWAKDLLANSGQFNFDEITYDYFRDDSVALQAFTKGDLDIRREYDISNWVTSYGNLGDHFTRAEIPHQRPERARGLIFNTRRTPFDDINVRKALSLAFDAEWIGKNIFYGRYKRINSFFPNSSLTGAGQVPEETLKLLNPWGTTLPPEVFHPDYETFDAGLSTREKLRQADDFLKQAGWLIQDGKRIKDAKALSFEILIGTPEDEKVALNFQRNLKRLGIEMRVRLMDTAAFQDRLQDYDFDMVSYFWQNSLSPGTEQLLYWSCESAKQKARWNFAGICMEAVDTLAAAIAETKNYSALENHAQALDRVLLSQYIFIPLFYAGEDYIAHKKSIHRPENIPIYGAVLESWWMDKAQE